MNKTNKISKDNNLIKTGIIYENNEIYFLT